MCKYPSIRRTLFIILPSGRISWTRFLSHLLGILPSSKHHFLNFFCVSGTHWGLAPSLCSHFPALHWISSVALPPFATQSMYTHSRCPGHLMISPLTGMLMDVRE